MELSLPFLVQFACVVFCFIGGFMLSNFINITNENAKIGKAGSVALTLTYIVITAIATFWVYKDVYDDKYAALALAIVLLSVTSILLFKFYKILITLMLLFGISIGFIGLSLVSVPQKWFLPIVGIVCFIVGLWLDRREKKGKG